MTLNTSIAIHEPMPVADVYAFCRELIDTPDSVQPRWGTSYLRQSLRVQHPIGVGLAALLAIYYGADGPLGPWKGDDDPAWQDEESRAYALTDNSRNGWAAIEVTFDTEYAYREANGAGCSDLHAWLVRELGRWLDERGKSWRWQNEFTGDWYDRYEGLTEFGNPDVGDPRSTVVRQRPEDGHEAFVRRLFGTPA